MGLHNERMMKPIKFPCHVVGLMSGTSADGVDAALLYTDGREILETGATHSIIYSNELRSGILGLMQGQGDLKGIQRALTLVHMDAVSALRERTKEPISLIGFHGQTIKHAPERGFTQQIGDGQFMAKMLGISVVVQFRTRDVREGGQGAPLVPLYHAALATQMPKPLMVVNIGGVSNITWLGPKGEIIACDSGPGNALMDDWFFQHTGARYDEHGRVASRGKIDEARVKKFLSDPYFKQPMPKSLDRNHFSLQMVAGMSVEDGTATLAAMTARAIIKACEQVPQMPTGLVITGGGRHNLTLMQLLRSYGALESGKPEFTVQPVEALGWDGDMLEAQAFAYLAARSVQGLALSLPTTTGVNRPVTGGVFYQP